MGKKSGTETVVAIVQAFLRQRTWKQADLAREVGVQSPAVRKTLLELSERGFPLDAENEHPHVYWSVPSSWFPGGVAFGGKDVEALLRLLARSPKSDERDRLLDKILGTLPKKDTLTATVPVVTPVIGETEQRFLPPVEDAAARRTTLFFEYLTASAGNTSERHASVVRVVPGPPARFVAFCHRSEKLKWFRLKNVLRARLDAGVPFRPVPDDEIEAFVAASIDGFHAGDRSVRAEFFVRDPESRWVQRNLPAPMRVEPTAGGVLVATETAALLPLARFVVGLGEAARPTTPELAELVRELARGALAQL